MTCGTLFGDVNVNARVDVGVEVAIIQIWAFTDSKELPIL